MAEWNNARGLTVGLVGVGVVGGALREWLTKATEHAIKVYDPAKGFFDSLEGCDVTFISVPVPTSADGSQDQRILEDAVKRAKGIKFIRSTVVPGTNDRLGTFSCPEFLTERRAIQDTFEMDVLCGYNDGELLSRLFPNKSIYFFTNKECEIAKYAHNVMGAIKVNLFNIIHDICEKEGANYEHVRQGVLMSGYINETHTRVPGPDGKFGFGGTCFPKDLKAFNYCYPFMTFAACMSENNLFRTIVERVDEIGRGKTNLSPAAKTL
jgi:UDP-glucose 6-dehydrogenase